ncbi:6-phosphogluconate dehydrogenase (decarboxylating) [Candidatus Woesearchaeota archaeon]|nr:6-phosphogluconate dehydrogenase (decarboxylating) [Candidatus Woesearchaeota archaeon]
MQEKKSAQTSGNAVGIIGLGKMGSRMALRLAEQGLPVTAYDPQVGLLEGVTCTDSIKDLVQRLQPPRHILLLLPAGKAVDDTVTELTEHLTEGDTIIDMGNSAYDKSILRHKFLKRKGINFLDAGISGGIEGASNGACIMVGGEKNHFQKAEHIFKAASKDGSYAYLGGPGAGHLVKGYHNLVEYGFLQSIAEGLHSIRETSRAENLDVDLIDVCRIWNKGSIVESRICGYVQEAMEGFPGLDGIPGTIGGQTTEEMIQLIEISEKKGVPTPCGKAATEERKRSQQRPTFAGKIINGARKEFGGHHDWKKQ